MYLESILVVFVLELACDRSIAPQASNSAPERFYSFPMRVGNWKGPGDTGFSGLSGGEDLTWVIHFKEFNEPIDGIIYASFRRTKGRFAAPFLN
jgi:hypothetical protein